VDGIPKVLEFIVIRQAKRVENGITSRDRAGNKSWRKAATTLYIISTLNKRHGRQYEEFSSST